MLRYQLSIKVFVIGPPLACWGLERLIASAHPRIVGAGTAASAAEALPQLQREACDVVLADINAAEIIDSLELLQGGCEARVVVIASSKDHALLDRAVLAGVRGIVWRHDKPAVALAAIEKVHDGELWIDRDATGRIFMEMARRKASEGLDPENTKIATLTLRERQTIAAMTNDASVPAKVIAGRMCISEYTLRHHLTSIYAKLGLVSRLDLYAYATRYGLNEPR